MTLTNHVYPFLKLNTVFKIFSILSSMNQEIMLYRFYSPVDENNEICYYAETSELIQQNTLQEFLGDLQPSSSLTGQVYEVGPRLSFKTSWSSNVLEIFRRCGIETITRIEKSRRSTEPIQFDKMTEQVYPTPLETLSSTIVPEGVRSIPRDEIAEFSRRECLGWDSQDVEYYTSLFDRDPTNVELLDLAQSNSEHSRHTFFNGRQIIDGLEKPKTLFQLIKNTLPANTNSVLAFCDNASAIRGFSVEDLTVSDPTGCDRYVSKVSTQHPTLTAETHNFPTGVAPFPGATTGVGGRIRDTIAIGRGGRMVAGTAGYCVADQQLLVDASNGASDYGNKVGEPIIQGFTRFYDAKISGRRWAWIKPIMFSGGIGMVSDENLLKGQPSPGMLIVRAGGPAYRIGMGGSTASSQELQIDNLNAVQRGDPEMENRLCNFIRNLTDTNNPIVSIHDQGAGGTANVTKEIVEGYGGVVDINKITCGDPTMTTFEKWIAEYQEQVTFLIRPEDLVHVQDVAKRENVDITVFGNVTKDNHIRVIDGDTTPVDLSLGKIFDLPQKTFRDRSPRISHPPLILPRVNFVDILKKVFALESVGSKRFLINKVDRSVSGLIVQEQTCGPLFTPISDYAIVAHSWNSTVGTVTSIGEQPLKAFYTPGLSGELAVVEAITNIMWTIQAFLH